MGKSRNISKKKKKIHTNKFHCIRLIQAIKEKEGEKKRINKLYAIPAITSFNLFDSN